jgi:UDP-2,3-diacylglucosamine pyrophosphatase LpxH
VSGTCAAVAGLSQSADICERESSASDSRRTGREAMRPSQLDRLRATVATIAAFFVITPSRNSVRCLRMGSEAMSEESPERRFRTLFISDVHLGARGSQAERLLDFLRSHDADTIYLVGDIVDGWALQSSWYWPQSHNDFVQKMLRKARKGAKIVYVPGNHDEFLRNYYGTHFGGIDVVENTIHEGVDGRRYLVIHGDIFDLVVQNARWLAHLGDTAYDFAIRINRFVNMFRRWFGVPYWSLSQWAKLKVKNAVNYIGAFEQTLAAEARRHGADGVICGHIHYATIRDEHGIRYMNCGDWVESCTALAEHEDGRFEIITWIEPLRRVAPISPVAVRAA